MKKISLTFLLCIYSILLSACGGGSSSSGSPQILYSEGDYTGALFLMIGNSDYASELTETSVTFTVSGSQIGTQRVSVAFVQFSANSLIDSAGKFSIASGIISLRIVDPSREQTFATCQGELIFDGVIFNTSIEGDITGQFNCPFSNSPLIADGTFSANLNSVKQNDSLTDLDFLFKLK